MTETRFFNAGPSPVFVVLHLASDAHVQDYVRSDSSVSRCHYLFYPLAEPVDFLRSECLDLIRLSVFQYFQTGLCLAPQMRSLRHVDKREEIEWALDTIIQAIQLTAPKLRSNTDNGGPSVV